MFYACDIFLHMMQNKVTIYNLLINLLSSLTLPPNFGNNLFLCPISSLEISSLLLFKISLILQQETYLGERGERRHCIGRKAFYSLILIIRPSDQHIAPWSQYISA